MERGREGLRSCLEEVPGWGNRAGVRYPAQSTLSVTQQTSEAAVTFARCHILSLGFSWPQEHMRTLTLQGMKAGLK